MGELGKREENAIGTGGGEGKFRMCEQRKAGWPSGADQAELF